MQIPHAVTVGDVRHAMTMHALHRGDPAMQRLHGHDHGSASSGHNMQSLHTRRGYLPVQWRRASGLPKLPASADAAPQSANVDDARRLGRFAA